MKYQLCEIDTDTDDVVAQKVYFWMVYFDIYTIITQEKLVNIEEHLQTADDLAIACHHLKRIFNRCLEKNDDSTRIMQLLRKVHPSLLGETIIQIKSELDSQYHSLVTESQFDELGHIYYNLDERYNSLDIIV